MTVVSFRMAAPNQEMSFAIRLNPIPFIWHFSSFSRELANVEQSTFDCRDSKNPAHARNG
jgi:hypothetical protein